MLRLPIIVLLFQISVSAWAQEVVPGRVIVKLKNQTGVNAASFNGRATKAGRAKHYKSWYRFNMHAYEAKGSTTTAQLMADLSNDPDVEYVEPDYVVKKSDAGVVEQSYSSAQVQAFVSGFGLTSNEVQGVQAWAEVTQSNMPVVAVIDTGMDLYHEALSSALWVNIDEIAGNGLDDDGNGFVDDRYGWNFADDNNNPQDCDGHGTHVAGIIRGTTQDLFENPIGAPIIHLMPVKFLDCYGAGSTSAAISAIYYAVNNGAKILNNSWGGGAYSRSLHEAILYSYYEKTIFVAASGNSSNNNDSSKTYPASYDVPNVLSVAASTSSDYLASFSNYGVNTVHIASPGVSILSSYPGDQYATLSGTSMAAPFITGVAALIMNEQPTMNGYQTKSIIMSTADSRSSLSSKVATGGRVNNLSAVQFSKSATVSDYMPDYGIKLSGEDRNVASALASGGAGCGLVQAFKGGDGGPGSWNTPSGTPVGMILLISVLMLLPILLTQLLKEKKNQQHEQDARRRYPRYEVQGQASLVIDGQEVQANLETLSVGGAGFDAKVSLATGSALKIRMKTPDGAEVEVMAEVVWSRDTSHYGVRFENQESALDKIKAWTRRLALMS